MQSSIQDAGRIGYAGMGVPRSGAIDPVAMKIGNALVGNAPDTALIEFRLMGPKIVVEKGSVRIGLAGDIRAEHVIHQNPEIVKLSPWQSVTLNEKDTLSVPGLNSGSTGYISFEGGIDLVPELGSASTYAPAGLGGLKGANLEAGDILTLKKDQVTGADKIVSRPPMPPAGPFRVIPGPQDDYFSAETIGQFQSKAFKVGASSDRMGIRLTGERINALPEKGHDLISDGLVPGAIQVPASGQPIILSADCQSVGGYPKIATVITADLWRLGQLSSGDGVFFEIVSIEQAAELRQNLQKLVQGCIGSIQEYYGAAKINVKALYGANVVSGVVNANAPGHFPGHLEDMT